MRLRILGCCLMLILLSVSSISAQSWQQAYQKDYDLVFYDVHFPTSIIGYVVGEGGIILKSSTGGSSYGEIPSPVTQTLNSVYFTSSTNGWAVGNGGTIIYTTDGYNWIEHDSSTVMTTTDLRTVKFIGSKGWIGGEGGEIYITNDGGANWVTPTTNPYTDDVNALDFFDTSVGYAAMDGDGIMYTTDGGDNWTAAVVNLGTYPYTRDDIEAIMTVDDTTAVAAGWGSLVGPQPTIIVVSLDAGKTWNIADPLYDWETYCYGWGFGMFDDGEIVLTGGGSGSAGVIVHSTDSGDNWTASQAFAGEDIRACCAVPGTNRMVAVGDEGIIALSTDKAQTWTFNYRPGNGFAGWHAFTHASSDMVIGCGANGSLIKLVLDDTGAPTGAYRFSVVSPRNFASTILQDINYVGGVLYVCGSYGELHRSTDLGETWEQLDHVNSATSGKYNMHWFDADNGIIVGEIASRETIWKTTDGGDNLVVIWNDSLGVSAQWNSISFAPENPNVGVICGDDRRAIYTTDGGNSWNWSSGIPAGTGDLEAVHMVTATDGYIVGDAGVVYVTSDGGANWSAAAAPVTTKTLMDVFFRYPDQAGQGWICGDDQTFFYTNDGGANWTAANPVLDPTTKDINGVYFQRVVGRLWIGVDDADIFTRAGDDVTAVEKPIRLPYVLGQNYPNPFGPSTSIDISLTGSDHVTLNVYDVSGRLVAKVMDRKLAAGDITVHFDAKGLAAGIYFYKLTTSSGVETRKMVLIR